jgi:rubrerythrin
MMRDRLLKESDVLKIAFQLPLVVNSAFADAVKALQSADRLQGEWIGARIGHYPGYECSLCHYGVQPWNTTRYCPNCGARMKGADDEMR